MAMAERRYLLRTFGCQMNEHDSERIAGLLTADGYVATEEAADANVVVFNTCAIRENADNRLYGNLGHLRPLKQANPRMRIVVAGCLAQKDGGTIRERAPWVDVVVGTHALPGLLDLLHRAETEGPQLDVREQTEVFPSALPALREVAHHAWVSIAVGCDNACTFCIVPLVRGPQLSRPIGDVLAEVQGLARPGRGRDHAARPEREHVRARPHGAGLGSASAVRRSAPGRERGRRAPPDPVHEPAPARLHAGRDRRDGREREGVRAHPLPAAIGLGPRAEGDAAFVPARALPRLARTDPRRDPGHRGEHRHHRRVPRGDRGGLRGHARCRSARALRPGVHVPVLAPAGDARRRDGWSARQARGPGAVRPAGRAPGGDRARADARTGGLVGRGADRGARPQGWRAGPDAGQPGRARRRRARARHVPRRADRGRPPAPSRRRVGGGSGGLKERARTRER